MEQAQGAGPGLPGREQVLLTGSELHTRFGRKFVDETELFVAELHMAWLAECAPFK
jgi:hypothetical protein